MDIKIVAAKIVAYFFSATIFFLCCSLDNRVAGGVSPIATDIISETVDPASSLDQVINEKNSK